MDTADVCNANMAAYKEIIQQAREDPVGVAQLCGNVMGELILNSEHFSHACAVKWITEHNIPHRIDFLLSCEYFYPRDKEALSSIKWTTNECGQLDIESIGDDFQNVHILVCPHSKNYPNYYEIHDVKESFDWSFDVDGEEIIASSMSAGFHRWERTRCMVLLIRWFTNVLGYHI